MKSWLKWLLIGLLIAGVSLGVMRALKTRKDQQTAVAAASASKTQTVVELASTDLIRATQRELGQGVSVTGALKATHSAVIKARVAGELQGLTVREGDSVKAGQVLARIESVEYEARVNQAQRQAEAAKAQIDIARRQFDNNKALVDQGFISKTALDTSAATLDSAQASYKAALASTDVARKSLDDTVLRSPLSGGPLIAKVARINPSTQPGSRSVLIYLTLDSAEGLRQGLYAEGRLGTGRVSAVTIPLTSVRTDKPAPYVQLLVNDKVVHRVVSITARGEAAGVNDLLVAVTGLTEGETVLAGSVGALREDTPVKLTAGK